MRIAIDAMGGDFAPHETVAGAIAGLDHLEDGDRLVLIGQENRIRAELDRLGHAPSNSRIEIVHADEIIEMGEHPVEALKQKRNSSIAKMAFLAAKGQVDAVISAGNTGACVAACQMKLRSLEGVARPGIAVVVPSFERAMVLCDVGANPAPKPHHMHQYALMCSIYAEAMFDLSERPRVALLSIGEESAKGSPLVKQVRDLIREDPRINFVGYVEGRTLLSGQADVIICDGFVGNVALKLIEGLAVGLVNKLAKDIAAAEPKLAQAFEPLLKNLWQRHDYSEHGGAPLLGVDGVCIICHGSSDRRAIRNAVVAAYKLAGSNINERIVEFFKGQQTHK